MSFKGLKKVLGAMRKHNLKKTVRRSFYSNPKRGIAGRNMLDVLIDRKNPQPLEYKRVAGIATSQDITDPMFRNISETAVDDTMRGKGLGKILFDSVVKRSKGKFVTGDVQSARQAKIRQKYKTSKEMIETNDIGMQSLKVPKKGFKKHKNMTTGKVKFIRKNGRIIPIRSKRKK